MQITTYTHTGDRYDVGSFLGVVERYDGEFPLSEYKELRRGKTGEVIEMLAIGEEGDVVGYVQAAWHPAGNDLPGHYGVEMAVAHDRRATGVAADLLGAIEARLDTTRATLWANRDYVALAARSRGWSESRRLLRMTTVLPAFCPDGDESALPIDTFQPGRDDAAWLQANNLAFAGHPENGCLRQTDLDLRMGQPWFDAAGFFLAWDGHDVAGSCWTKVHPDEVGEIYIIGVVPRWEGRGLGRALVCRGLRYLGEELGLSRAILYTEAENLAAIGLYESLGFETERSITAYAHPRSS